MKYTKTTPPLVCMMTNSTCYRDTTHPMTVRGVLWHSTGANNPTLRRYVQPDDDAPDCDALLQKIGINANKNDWNHKAVQAGLNAWVGKLANGTVSSVQTMPWDYKPWGCGGTCNNGWIQFEICEDDLGDREYFEAAYKEACELTAYLCTLYGIDPCGTVPLNGKTVPTILCHADSAKLGLGSNHGDIYHWFPKFGKDMASVREDVCRLMGRKYTAVSGAPTASGSASVSIPSITCKMPKLSQGCEGEAVKSLQQLLIARGFDCGSAAADGDFGSGTLSALKAFQKAQSITADGVAGSQVYGKLWPSG